MGPRSNNTTVVTLALGTSVLITVMSGVGEANRPPVGARTAFELIANKSGRKKAFRCEALGQKHRNQSHLKTPWRRSHSAVPADLAEDRTRVSLILTQTPRELE